GDRGAVVEEAVDDLVQRAIPADRDHHLPRLPDRPLRDLGGLERPGRERGLEGDARRREPRLDRGPLAGGLAGPRRGVDDEEHRGAGLTAYLEPPMALGFMIPWGSSPSLTARHTFIQPPISSATH